MRLSRFVARVLHFLSASLHKKDGKNVAGNAQDMDAYSRSSFCTLLPTKLKHFSTHPIFFSLLPLLIVPKYTSTSASIQIHPVMFVVTIFTMKIVLISKIVCIMQTASSSQIRHHYCHRHHHHLMQPQTRMNANTVHVTCLLIVRTRWAVFTAPASPDMMAMDSHVMTSMSAKSRL